MKKYLNSKFMIVGTAILGLFSVAFFTLPELTSPSYKADTDVFQMIQDVLTDAEWEDFIESTIATELEIRLNTPVATHIEEPEAVKAVYMTSWVASTPSFRKKIVQLIDDTEVNAVVIDIKDYTGRIAFTVDDFYLRGIGSEERRIRDIVPFINKLHEKGIWVIGRISVFQDPYLIKKEDWKQFAVKRASDGAIWKDRKGIGWFDAGSQEVWDYAVAIGHEAYNKGFDELNFDYVRFPSDGDIQDISYPVSEGKVKEEVLRDFFMYIGDSFEDTDAIVSVDLFGMTMTNTDDLNIGQVLEYTAPYVDYVYPMVYPSHFPPNWNGISKPAKEPYKVIKYSMDKGRERLVAIGEDPLKLRPWIQDFNLGATYTAEMVRAQIDATYDAGLTSWLIWDASNTYTQAALLTDSDL